MWWLWGTSSILLPLPSAICHRVMGSWLLRRGRVMLILVVVAVAATPWGVKVTPSKVQGQEKELVEHGEPFRCSACLVGGSMRNRLTCTDVQDG